LSCVASDGPADRYLIPLDTGYAGRSDSGSANPQGDGNEEKSDGISARLAFNVKVTVFGNTAIATRGFNGKGTDATGKPLNVNERWTDTWVNMSSGQWQCVASHASPIKS